MRELPHVLGIVLAGGEGKRLYPLTADRAKPAVPFGGAYRLIDFVLSNLVNARYLRICVLTQYKSHSLDRHISQNWRLSGLAGEYITPVPAQQRLGPRWYTGSADAILQSLNLIYDEDPDYVVVFGADHIYRMDPEQMLQFHIESGAGATVAGIRVPRAEATAFGCIDADESGPHPRVRGEARRPAGHARRSRADVRVDGQLHLHHQGARRRHPRRRRRRRLRPRHGRRHHPAPGARRHGRGLRLQRQRGARRHRARSRLLARRRDAGRVLRRAHGSGVGAPGVQPVQPALADPRRAGEPGAGQVRQRRLGAGVGRRRGQHHLGGVGAQFGAVVQRRRSTTARSSRAAC